MKSRLNYKSKRTIIIVAIIIALLAIASTGIYIFTKGNDEARAFTEGNTTIGGSETNPSEEGNQSGNPVEEQPAIEPNIEPEQGSQNNEGGETVTNPQTPNTTGTTNNQTTGTTTSTTASNVPNQEYVTERQEEVERLVSESFLVGWAPISVASMTDDIDLNKEAEEPAYTVKKVATLINGVEIERNENEITTRVKPGDVVTYTITVTNMGNTTLQNIKVVDQLANSEESMYEETIPVLAIGDSKEIKVEYTVKQSDMDENEKIVNTVKATTPNEEKPIEDEEEIPVNPYITVSGTKTWVDGNKTHNNEKEITLTLYRTSAKEESNEEKLTTTATWNENTYTFNKLEKYDEEGYEYTYRVEETQVAGYEKPSYATENKNNITNTITDPSNVTVSGTKTWVDGNRTHNNAEDVELTLYRTSAKAGSVEETVTATVEWNGNTYTFSGLENYDAEGYAYTYRVVETRVDGYEVPAYNGNDITNTITDPSNATVSGTKTWVDGNRTHNNAEDVELTLYRTSAKAGSVEETVTATVEWNGNTYTFSGLENYDAEGYAYTYRVVETRVDGYEVPAYNGNDITNTITDPSNVAVSGTKTWVDGGKTHNNDEEVTLTLYRTSTKAGSVEEVVEATAKWEGNKYTFTGLENYDAEGYAYTYRVVETRVDGYEVPAYNGNDITNTIADPSNVTVSGTKTWVDGNRTHNNTEDVELTLYRKSAKAGSVEETVTATVEWNGNTYTFSGLENYDAEGYAYTYRVVETRVDGYEVPAYNGNDITNTITDPTNATVSGTKTWVDGNRTHNNDEDVELTLYRKSAKAGSVEETVTATVEWNGNTYTFGKLENYDAEGYAYTYRVVETRVDGYEVPAYNGNDITNTITDPSNVTVSGTKTWVDGGKTHNNDEEVTLTLYRTSTKAGSVEEVVEATAKWKGNKYTFTGLENYDAEGYAYTYRVVETRVDGYEVPAYNENDITNTITDPSNVAVSGTKTWIDGGKTHNNDEEVTLTLYRTSTKAGSVEEVVKATVKWEGNKYTFTGLENYDAEGYEYTYRVEETKVDGYNTPEYATDNKNNITNTITDLSNKEVTGIKTWVDGGKTHNNAEEVTLTLYRKSTKAGSVEEVVEATAKWEGNKYTFTGLENYDAEGYEYTYRVEETKVDGYNTPEYATDNKNNITNTITDLLNKEVTGTKTWVDGNREHDNATEITLTLYRKSAKAGSVEEVVEATAKWEENQYTFTGLENYDAEGYEYTYRVEETKVDGYNTPEYATDNKNNITNTIKQEKIEVTVSKVWDDGDNQDGNRKSNIEIQLYAKVGENTTAQRTPFVLSQESATNVLKDEKGNDIWQYVFTDLNKYDQQGNTITYIVRELSGNKPVESNEKNGDYTVTYVEDYNEFGNRVVTITNSYTPEKVNNDTGKIKVTKNWVNDTEANRPKDGITIQLKSKTDKETTKTNVGTPVTIKLNNGVWEYEYTDLPANRNGRPITYSVEEVNVPTGYKVTYGGTVKEGLTIINTYLKPEITVTKTSEIYRKDTKLSNETSAEYGDIIKYTITATNKGNKEGTVNIKDSLEQAGLKDKVKLKSKGELTNTDYEKLTSETGLNVTVPKATNSTTPGIKTIEFELEIIGNVNAKILNTAIVDGTETPDDKGERTVEKTITYSAKTTSMAEKNITIVLDLSSSMNTVVEYDRWGNPKSTRLDAAKSAIETFVNTIYGKAENKDVKISVVTFNYKDSNEAGKYYNEKYDNVIGTKLFAEITKDNKTTEIAKIKGITLPNGTQGGLGTNITAGLTKAEQLTSGDKENNIVILLGDGNPSEGYDTKENAKDAADSLKTKAILYTISFSGGYGNAADPAFMKQMATNADNDHAFTSDNASKLTENFSAIFSQEKDLYKNKTLTSTEGKVTLEIPENMTIDVSKGIKITIDGTETTVDTLAKANITENTDGTMTWDLSNYSASSKLEILYRVKAKQ